MRSGRYNEIFVQKIPIFYDTAISSIARRYCQEDPYYSVSSVNSWRTRDDILQEDPCILSYCCHQLIAGAHDVLTSSNNNSQ